MSDTPLQQMPDVDLAAIVPESIRSDEQVSAAIAGIQPQIGAVVKDITSALPLLPNLDKLPGRVVDLLANQYHVDFYDSSASIEARRDRVRKAVQDHRIAGTREGMKRALQAVFNSTDFDIVEWWEMDPPGDPYTFFVFIHVPFTDEQFTRAKALAEVLGNVRSEWVGYITWAQLEGLGYTWAALEALGLEWQQLTYYYIYGPA